jgi:hypothetical protein
MSEWRPIILTEKATGRSIHITIFDRELYKSGFFTFEDLWEMYGADEHPGNVTETGGDDG